MYVYRVQPGVVPGVVKTPRTDSASSEMKKKDKDKVAIKDVESRKRKRSALEEIREVTALIFQIGVLFSCPHPSLDGGEEEGEVELKRQLDYGGVLVWPS